MVSSRGLVAVVALVAFVAAVGVHGRLFSYSFVAQPGRCFTWRELLANDNEEFDNPNFASSAYPGHTQFAEAASPAPWIEPLVCTDFDLPLPSYMQDNDAWIATHLSLDLYAGTPVQVGTEATFGLFSALYLNETVYPGSVAAGAGVTPATQNTTWSTPSLSSYTPVTATPDYTITNYIFDNQTSTLPGYMMNNETFNFVSVFLVNHISGPLPALRVQSVQLRTVLAVDIVPTGTSPSIAGSKDSLTVEGDDFYNSGEGVYCRFASDPDTNVPGTYVSPTAVKCQVPFLSIDDFDERVSISLNGGSAFTGTIAFTYDAGEIFGLDTGTVARLGIGMVALIILGSVTVVGAFVYGSYRFAVQSGVVGYDGLDDVDDSDDDAKGAGADKRKSSNRRSKEGKVGAIAATYAVSRARMSMRADAKEMRKLLRSQALSNTEDSSRPIAQVVANVDAAPTPVVKAVTCIEDHGLQLEGIFRISGSLEEVQKLARLARTKPAQMSFNQADPHAVAGWLKLHFRKRMDPVVPEAIVMLFQSKHKTSSMMETAFLLKDAVRAMPQRDRAELELICRLAAKVAEHTKHNRMSLDNLTMVLGPSVIRHNDLATSFALMNVLIRLSGLIFGDDSSIGSVSDQAMSALMQPAVDHLPVMPEQAPPADLAVPRQRSSRSRSPVRPPPQTPDDAEELGVGRRSPRRRSRSPNPSLVRRQQQDQEPMRSRQRQSSAPGPRMGRGRGRGRGRAHD